MPVERHYNLKDIYSLHIVPNPHGTSGHTEPFPQYNSSWVVLLYPQFETFRFIISLADPREGLVISNPEFMRAGSMHKHCSGE